MRESEHPDLFPQQERKAVDVYAHRVARNSVLSDVAAVAAADALAAHDAELASEAEPPAETSAPVGPPVGPDGGGQHDHAEQHECDQEHNRHIDAVPERDAG